MGDEQRFVAVRLGDGRYDVLSGQEDKDGWVVLKVGETTVEIAPPRKSMSAAWKVIETRKAVRGD